MGRRPHAGIGAAGAGSDFRASQTSRIGLDDSQLLSGGAKIFMDGSGGARTAWLNQPWNKNRTETDGTNVGYPATDPEIYRQMVRLFHQAGVHVGTHAIGDRAIDWVVDTYAEVLKEKPTRGLRHSIIHCQYPDRSRHRCDGVLAEAIRRRLPRSASAVHVVDRRYTTRAISVPSAPNGWSLSRPGSPKASSGAEDPTIP